MLRCVDESLGHAHIPPPAHMLTHSHRPTDVLQAPRPPVVVRSFHVPLPSSCQLELGFIAADAKDPSAVSDSDQLVGWVPSRVLAAYGNHTQAGLRVQVAGAGGSVFTP